MMALLSALPGSVAQGLIWGVMALGVFVTYKVLDYADLSVDGSFCTGGAAAAVFIVAGVPPVLAILIAFAFGMVAGLATGILHTKFGIPPILSGILTQLGLYSINMRIMGGKATQAISVDKYDLIVSLRHIPQAVLVGLVAVGITVAVLYWFFGTELGCAVRATGANPDMSRAQGINTDRMKIIGLVLSNGMVGLAGGLYAQYQGAADINMGRGAIVIGLAAVIIGEVVFGKRFNFAYCLASVAGGAIIYYIVIAVVLQLGLSTSDLKLFSALVVAVALALPYLKTRYWKNTRTPVQQATAGDK